MGMTRTFPLSPLKFLVLIRMKVGDEKGRKPWGSEREGEKSHTTIFDGHLGWGISCLPPLIK